MLAGIFHQGSGLGDQLMRYVTVRTLAESRGWDWGMFGEFKGKSFMDIYWPNKEVIFVPQWEWLEKEVRDANGVDIRSYDPEINFVQDNTIIDGGFEDFKYWGHNLASIDKWIEVYPLHVPDETCVIGFRGGEYATVPDLFLPQSYWEEAIERMKARGITRFEVHTDDSTLARQFFPDYPIVSSIGTNWRSVRFAKHAIIANSAFYIMPRLLSGGVTVAPRFWARRNIEVWARPACYYSQFQYI